MLKALDLKANKKSVEEYVGKLTCDDPSQRQQAVNEISDLARKTSNKAVIREAGGIAPLVSLLTDADTVVRRNAAGALRDLTTNDTINNVLVQQTGSIALSSRRFSFERLVESLVVRQNEMSALWNKTTENQMLIREAGGIAPLVGLLIDADMVVRRNAAGALRNLMANNMINMALIRKAGGIPLLLDMLNDSNGRMIEQAVGMLEELAVDIENRVAIQEDGGIVRLANLLNNVSPYPLIYQYATSALVNLAFNNPANKIAIKVAIIDANAFSVLKTRSINAEGNIKASAQDLINSCQYVMTPQEVEEEEKQLAKLEQVKKNYTKLAHQDSAERISALYILRSLMMHKENQKFFRDMGGISRLVDMLSDSEPDVRKFAARGLRELQAYTDNRVVIQEAGTITLLVDLLKDIEPETKKNAAFMLSNLAFQNIQNCVMIQQAGGVLPLVGLLKDIEPETRKNAVTTLHRLIDNDSENRVSIREAGGIVLLLNLLKDLQPGVRTQAAALLWDLAVNPINQLVIIDAGALPAIEHLAKGSECEIQTYAQGIIYACQHAQANREAIELEEQAGQRHEEISAQLSVLTSQSDKQALTPPSPPVSQPKFSLSSSVMGSEECDHFDLDGMGRALPLIYIQAHEIRLGKKLGQGGFGAVYEGEYKFQQVAVKRYEGSNLSDKNKATKAMRDEMSIHLRLDHKCLVRFLGLVQQDNSPAMLVMELGKNGSLYNYLQSEQEISWGLRLRIAVELARGLAYLHAEKIIHRDIKSQNIVLDEDYHAKWCDFGLASLKLHSIATSKQEGGAVAGTERWMAPELFQDEAPICGTKTDIWALGMVYFELASREVPFKELRGLQLVLKLSQGKSETVPEACETNCPGFGVIMQRCWQERTLRPSAQTLLAELSCLEQLPEPPVSGKETTTIFDSLSPDPNQTASFNPYR